MPDTSPILGVPTLLGNDLVRDLDDWTRDLGDFLDAQMATQSAGPLSSRPVSTLGSPGIAGRFYRATDVGRLYQDHGTGWDELISATHAPSLGVNTEGVVRRGKSIVATEQTRTNAAYGLLTTPDRVQGVVLPTDGLLLVGYKALWKTGFTGGTAKAAIFLGANQVKIASDDGAPVVQEATRAASSEGHLVTTAAGLFSPVVSTIIAAADDMTTGQVLGVLPGSSDSGGPFGGFMAIFAAAGTYDVSVQFANSGGDVIVKQRKLWVEARAF